MTIVDLFYKSMMQLQTIALYHLILMYGQAEDVNLPM